MPATFRPGKRPSKYRGKEAPVQKQVIDYLKLRRLHPMRINAGMLPDATGRPVRMAPTGTSDVILVMPPRGRFFAVEVKAPGLVKNLTDAQRTFLESVRNSGGIGIVVDDVKTVERVVDALFADPMVTPDLYGAFA